MRGSPAGYSKINTFAATVPGLQWPVSHTTACVHTEGCLWSLQSQMLELFRKRTYLTSLGLNAEVANVNVKISGTKALLLISPVIFTRHKLVPLQVSPAVTDKSNTMSCHASSHLVIFLLLLHVLPSASTSSLLANGHTWKDWLCRDTRCRALTPSREHLPAWLAACSSGYDKIHNSSRWSGYGHRKDDLLHWSLLGFQ